MTTLQQVINKFNIPNKEDFKNIFDLKINDNILEGSLNINNNIYSIKNGEDICMFCFIFANPKVIIGTECHGAVVGTSYETHGSRGFIS